MWSSQMKNSYLERPSERGGAAVKLLLVAAILLLLAHAGYNYVPVAYEGASFRQEMDTAVVKGLAASGALKPVDIVKEHIQHAAKDYNVPPDAVIEITPTGKVIQAHATYSKQINMLPFGLYKYEYQFNHVASPTGYLTKE
jgi:hypothetical protein